MRKIIHVDMDAFYASVEQRDDPSLRGLPVAVGGSGGRGVVLTASYEARRFGVRSAMPGVLARRLCPDLLFVRPRFDAYRAASRTIREVFLAWTPLVEPLSLDEAYLDVTAACGDGPAMEIARAIKQRIRQETGLTASAGVSFNKLLAKLASDLRKPDGLSVIRPEKAVAFLAGLPIERFHGVGPATAARMRSLGIASGADLQSRSEAELQRAFGRSGLHYWRMARAIDERPVEPHRRRRSLSVEETFAQDLRGRDGLADELLPLADSLAERLHKAGFTGRTLTLKIKLADFRLVTRSITLVHPLTDAAEIRELAMALLDRPAAPAAAVRLLGLGVSAASADPDRRQLDLGLGLGDQG
ncbi:MAG TPA: DNA polymerase IV [Geminicoccaceae bacterium]|nr:DNA polymerase IV [Geminicoccus sp.]HMU49859.1 DNA polymerase IV [Geminicoccaceae bacterium]